MHITPISLGTRSNPARHGHAGAARLINGYAEDAGEDAKNAVNIHCVDGLAEFAEVDIAGGSRAALILDDNTLYVVIGRGLYKFDQAGASAYIGGIPTAGTVTMARNRADPPVVAIASDGLVFYCQDDVLTQNTDADLPPVNSVAALDGYFVFLCDDGRRFASGVDATTVEALDFAKAESNPDPGVCIATRGRDLVSFGTRSTEFDQNSGGETWPFSRTTAIEVGCLAAGSVATIDQTLAWVAHDGTVRRLNGYTAERISTYPVERFVSSHANPRTMTACSWSRNGNVFYSLSGDQGTWEYNLTTGRWHERKSYGLARWRGATAVQFGTKIIVGDYDSPTLYEMSPDYLDEAGTEIVMEVRAPPVHGFPYRLRHNALFLDVVPGVGRATEASHIANPSIMMDYSDDGGENWSTQRIAPLGREGDRLRRVRWNRLGVSRSRTYRFSVSASVARTLVSMSLDVDKLAA